MDGLKEIITSLDEAQQKEFIYFIQRNKYKKGRKDLLLFNLLKQPKAINQKDIITDLKTPNANGYHTIRKRLFNHLADFMIMKSVSSDASTKSHVNGLMAVINYLFDKNLDYYAWKYLDVAEKLALQHHYYDQLNSIFLLQIEKSPSNELIKLDKIIEKYQENKKHLELSERIKIAYSKIQNEYNFQKTKGITPDFEQLTLSILDQLKININVLQNPYILLEFTRITRAIALIKKDFLALEKFVLKNYNLCLKSNKELTTEVQGEFLYIVSHTTYRNKKFLDSIKALEELSNLIDTAPANFKRKYQNKINLLKIGRAHV